MMYAVNKTGSQPIIVADLRKFKSGVPSVLLIIIMRHNTAAVIPNMPKVENTL